jgi:hypothetical protein
LERSILDWGGNLVSFATMILLNVLSNAVLLNGQTMTAISAKYSSLFTPAGWGYLPYLADLRRMAGTASAA